MVIINQTFNVEQPILSQWIDWLKIVYIPEVMSSGLFTDHKILRLLSEDAANGQTFAVQFSMPSATYVNISENEFMDKYESLARKNFGDKVLFFRSVLEIVN